MNELMTVPALPVIEITINPEYVAKVEALEEQSATCAVITTNAECIMLNALNQDASKLAKTMENKRQEAKSPFLEAGTMIDAAAKPLIERAKTIATRTGETLLRYRRELQAKAMEQQRLQDAENLRIADEKREREREAELARRRNATPPPVITPPTPPPQAVQPKVEVPVINVTTRKTKVLRIYAPMLVPTMVKGRDGTVYTLHIINEAEVKRALKAGCEVPGARMEEEEGIVQK